MFTWIRNLFNRSVSTVGTAVAALVHDAISGLFGFLHTIFGLVGIAWNTFYSDIIHFTSNLAGFFAEVAQAFFHLWRVWIPNFLNWINVHILKPLLDAWTWISHQGATVWFYISHPDKLVDLFWNHLIVKIESTAWVTARLLGTFFLSLVVRNINKFVILIEDIVHAVF